MAGVFLLVAMIAPSGCRPSSSFTQIWRSPGAGTMTRLIVFGAKMSEIDRRVIEDDLVSELAKRNVTARPSYSLFPGPPPAREEAQERVVASGFEGILVVTLKNVEETQRFVPGHTTGFWSGYYGYYGPGWGYAYLQPGYFVTDRTVTCETTLWDTRAEDRLVWAALTETENPGNAGGFASSVSHVLARRLEQGQFIPPAR